MKKFLLLLIFISLVSCNNPETKENTYSFGEDTWIITHRNSNGFQKIDLSKESDLDLISFFEFKKGKLVDGYYYFDEYKKELEKNYVEDVSFYFEDEKMTILNHLISYKIDGIEENKSYLNKLEWKSEDSIYGKTFSIIENGIEIFDDSEFNDIMLIRLPKYSSSEARDILVKKKSDLDLELITQKQYDSIKNKLSRYIKD